MKVYPFILINKNNMTSIRHFKDATKVADAVYGKNGINAEGWVIVKDETRVIKLEPGGGDVISQYRRVIGQLSA